MISLKLVSDAGVYALLLMGAATTSAQIVNGDFSGGMTGWTASAFDRSFNPIDPAPFVNLTTVGGAPAVKMETGTYAQGLNSVVISQSFTVDPASPFLHFDFTLPTVFADGTGTGLSFDSDLFSATIFPNADLISVDRTGAISIIGPAFLGVVITDSTASGFTKSLHADLTMLAGSSVTLQYTVSQSDDGFLFDPYVSNTAMTPVPEPVHGTLAVALLCAGYFLRRRIRGIARKPQTPLV